MLLLKEIIVALVVILFSAWYYWQAGFLPTHSADPLGPAALPRFLATGMILFALAHIVVSYFRRKRLEEDEEPDPLQGAARMRGNLRILGVVVLTGAYIFFMVPLGYTLTTFIYLLLLTMLLGVPSIRGLAISTVGVTISLLLLFGKFLGVLLPAGFLEQLILH
ncbi:MAG: tripartite tricarboxylate transporter TctB family protein [Actinobacteria bacterium]|nr:tripartite tricarboxylate transporter TctB family protein [Actinomycetota bacterium]